MQMMDDYEIYEIYCLQTPYFHHSPVYKLFYHTQGRPCANEHFGFSDGDDTKLDQMDIPAPA